MPTLAHLPLGIVLMRAGRYAKAEQSLLQAIRALDETGMLPQHEDYQLALRSAVQLYETLGQKAKAEQYRRLLTPT